MKFTQRWRCSNQHALLHSKNAFLCWTISSFYFLFFFYSYLFSFGCCIYLASVCSVSGGCMSSSIRMWDTSLSQCLCSRVSWHRWQRVGKTAWAWAFKFTYQQIRLRKHNPLNALFFFLHVSSIFLCLLEDRLKDRTVVQNRIMRTVCVRSYYSTKQPWARASSAKRWSTFSGIVNRESDDCDRNMRQKVNNIHQKNVNVRCMRVDEHKTNTMERAKCMTSIVPRCVCSAVLPTSSTSSTSSASPTLPNK